MVIVAKRKTEPSSFGRKLREIREAAKLSQTDLGDMAGMAYQAIARYERGAVEPTWPAVVKIAEALGVTADAFRDSDETVTDSVPVPRPISKRK
jgi:transcriptional regulator with XRE-family HTH domain